MRSNQFAGFAFGDHPAVVQHQQAVAQAFGLVHEVGGEQYGFALLQQLLQALPHQVAGLGVQTRGGLVQHQQSRVTDQSARQTQAALHAPRQLARFGIGLVRQGRKFQKLWNARTDGGIGQTKVASKHQQVFGAGEVGVQGVELADHAQAGFDRQVVGGHVHAKGLNVAAVGGGQPQAHAQGGGFAGAVGPDHAQAFACRDGERHPVHGMVVAVAFVQIGAHQMGCAGRGMGGHMLRRYWPPTSNNARVICPSEQQRTASINTSNTLSLANAAWRKRSSICGACGA